LETHLDDGEPHQRKRRLRKALHDVGGASAAQRDAREAPAACARHVHGVGNSEVDVMLHRLGSSNLCTTSVRLRAPPFAHGGVGTPLALSAREEQTMTRPTTTPAPTPRETEDRDPVFLVGHDFSPCADAAADLALEDLLDSRRGGRLVLAHAFLVLVPPAVVDPSPMARSLLEVEDAARAQATQDLERVAERLRARQKARFNGKPPVEIEVVAKLGTPAETILAEAAARGAARIVVGTHGRRGLEHVLLGSVAERVARMATVPVLIAHARGAQS
jgi:nucleotide-binding universal stress UspA family protein